MFGMRVIVPAKLRSLLLDELHEGHPGIVRSKQLARSYVWWPSIEADLEHRVKACTQMGPWRCGGESPGVVVGQSGPLSFTVRVTTPRGSFTWRRHKDQLLGRTSDPDREASDQEGSEFLVVQPSVDPVTSSAPTTSGPDVSQEIQTAGARRYPLRNRRPPQKYQAGV
ncbi:hypothetical protein MTO96_005220 [Rhipicephalus appendiculatus]